MNTVADILVRIKIQIDAQHRHLTVSAVVFPKQGVVADRVVAVEPLRLCAVIFIGKGTAVAVGRDD